MKRWFKMLTGSLAVVLFITFSCAAFAAAPVKLRTAWLDEHEAFLVWYAKEKGWDKEEGLDIEMLLFSSGMAQLNALPAGEWVLAGTGAVPGMMGALRYGTYTIAVTNDESYTNALLLRPDSPILKTKGYNKDYPEVYGHPDDVRGKTFLITTMSSPHFTLSHWLRVLGLKESDVTIKNIDQAQGLNPKHPGVFGSPEDVRGKTILCTTVSSAHFALTAWLDAVGVKPTEVTIKNMDQPQALAAFENGIGDFVALWAPHMYAGTDKGWKVAGTPNTCGVGLPTVLMGDKKFCDANPELVAKFLRVLLRSANMLQKEAPESLAPEYCRFFQEFVGKSFTPEMAALDIKTHPVFNLEEQLALFDGSKGQSKAAKWMADIAEFFAGVGRITPDELKVVKDGSYATDKFLKLVKQPIPDYK